MHWALPRMCMCGWNAEISAGRRQPEIAVVADDGAGGHVEVVDVAHVLGERHVLRFPSATAQSNAIWTSMSFSSPSGVMCRLKFNFDPAFTRRPDSGGKMSAALPMAYSFRNAPVGSSSSSMRFVVAWWMTL